MACLCALAAILYVAANFKLEDMRLEQTRPMEFAEGWTAETDAGRVQLEEASRPAADRLSGTFILYNTLPKQLANNVSLCFQTKNESVNVWVEDRLVYTYGETPQMAYGHGVGTVWNMASLPDDSYGKEVRVELIPIGGRTGLDSYNFLLGSGSDIISYLLKERLLLLIVCSLLVLIGVGSMAVAFRGYYKRSDRASATFYFSLFVLLSALWMAADSGLLQFVMNNKGIIYLLFGCSFYLLLVPFAMFAANVLPQRRRCFWAFAAGGSLYAILRFVLYIFGVLDFETALWIVHLLMGSLVFVINITLWVPVIRTRKIENAAMCFAITAFSIVELIALFNFYMKDKLDILRNGYSSGFYIGIFAFVLIVIVGAVRQAEIMRRQAFKADFYERRANTDDLTGLLNVKGFDDKCYELLKSSHEGGQCYAMVDFDVNFFSQYNATNGLDIGNELIKGIGDILRANCGEDELCARQEADHFVCLLRGGNLNEIVERIRKTDQGVRGIMTEKMLLLSYGVVEVSDRTMSIAALRNHALVAKRTVKGNYEKNIAVYDRNLHEKQLREIELLSRFEEALTKGEYLVFLQPKMDIRTERLVGAEALVRHVEADGTLMGAGPIIQALENKGFVSKLDYYVFEQVCRFMQRCVSEGRKVYPISSNFSRVHLYDMGFIDRVTEIADKYGIPHELLEIEITETAFLAGKDILQNTAHSFHSRGFRISIDDFGSGYSSLNMLKDVEVDTIKLDREFLSGSSGNWRGRTVIEHTIHLAQELGITTVAEGIEDAQQLEFLKKYGCDFAQGYYYSYPLPEEEFIRKYLPPVRSQEAAIS